MVKRSKENQTQAGKTMVNISKEKWAGGRAREGCRKSSREVLLY